MYKKMFGSSAEDYQYANFFYKLYMHAEFFLCVRKQIRQTC